MASVVWRIRSHGAGSVVILCATIDATSRLDGLLVRLGGRRWLARRFGAALVHLSQELTAPGMAIPASADDIATAKGVAAAGS
jgi:hypothetical protein